MPPLPHFKNISNTSAFEPIHKNLFEAVLYDICANSNSISKNIYNVEFNVYRDSESVTMKIYNNSDNILTIDDIKSVRYFSMCLHTKTGCVQTSFYDIEFSEMNSTYGFDEIDVDFWTVKYLIKNSQQLTTTLEAFIRDAKITSLKI